MRGVLALLTTTWLETHQVHSTFHFEFARSMQTAVSINLWYGHLLFEAQLINTEYCMLPLTPSKAEPEAGDPRIPEAQETLAERRLASAVPQFSASGS